MRIKIGDTVITKLGIGNVIAKRKEPLGWFWIYDVEIGGKVFECHNVYLYK